MSHYWFISTKYRKGSAKLALITCALAFVVILLGAYTRLTNAGLSCPDWPNCYGYTLPPHTPTQLANANLRFPETPVDVKRAWTEMTHRYAAGAEGMLILLFVGSIFLVRTKIETKRLLIGGGLIALLLVQIMLGMLTVTAKLKPFIVLSHLLTGLTILSLLWWAYLDLNVHEDVYMNKHSGKLIPYLWVTFAVVILQIALGGWVSTHYAGLACIDFPYCNGQLIPPMQWQNWQTDLITIQMLHRFGAAALTVVVLFVSLKMIVSQSFRTMGLTLLLLLGLQLTLGIVNIIYLRPIWIALLHHMTAILILLTIITALAKAHYESRHLSYSYGTLLA